jgi:hypothetical protein
MHHNLLLLQLLFIPAAHDGSDREPQVVGEPIASQGRRPGLGAPGAPLYVNIFVKFFVQKLLPPRSGAIRSRPPGSGATMVYFCKFRKRKYIFIKNKNIKYKNIKTTPQKPKGHSSRLASPRSPARYPHRPACTTVAHQIAAPARLRTSGLARRSPSAQLSCVVFLKKKKNTTIW